MEKASYLTPEIQALLEQEVTWKATEPVNAGKIHRFAKSLGLDNAIYYDIEKGQPVAPPTFIFSVNHDSLGDFDETGRPTKRLSLPPPFGPAMRGGNKYQFFQRVRVGDQVWMKRKVTGLEEKQGRTGALLFLTYDVHYTNQGGDLLGINTETLIFRVTQEGKEKNKMSSQPRFEDRGEGQEIPPYRVTVSKVQMMMYAAATWNPNQLHWDSDFSKKRGFAEANIAGPMFGDYLAEMLVKWTGDPSRLKGLDYVNRNMAFPGDTLICRGKALGRPRQGNTELIDCQVWVENQKGGILVQGSALVRLA
jgi:hydroxyacyl-ACP dehydratase HTD2-like protein with hotdog domain